MPVRQVLAFLLSYWILTGVLILLYYITNSIIFSIWEFKVIPDSLVYLEVITSDVIILTTLLFIFTFNSGVSTFSIPIVSAIGVHFLLVFILLYYSFDGLHFLTSLNVIVMAIKLGWTAYELIFCITIIQYWVNRRKEETVPRRTVRHSQ